MKKIINNFLRFSIPATLVFGLLMNATPVSAGYEFNTASYNCDTVSMINATTREGYSQPCWNGKNVTARPGEEFNFKVFFSNSGNAPAHNVSVSINDGNVDSGTVSGTKTFRGSILVNGSVAATGTASVYFPSNVEVELVKVEFQTSDGRISDITNDSSVFSAGGRQVASVLSPNPADYGTIKAAYRVVSVDNGPDGSLPNVETGSNDVSGDDVEVRGSYTSSDDSSVALCFQYRKGTSGSITTINSGSRNATSGSFTDTINNLSDGDYQYRACVTNDYGTDYGSWEDFTIDDDTNNDENQCEDGIDNDDDGDIDHPEDNGCSSDDDDSEDSDDNNDSDLDVETLSVQMIDEVDGDVNFRGEYDNNEDGDAETYFEYRRDGGSIKTTSRTDYSNESRSFSRTVTGLSEGDYEYRACVENDTDEVCGSWKDFSIDRDEASTDEDLPTIQTLTPFHVGSDLAVLDGYQDMNGCSGKTWFEYGRTNSLGSTTTTISRSSNDSGSMAQSITGLSSGTTYYYRAVGQNCEGTVRGDIKSFRTDNQTVTTNTNTIRTITNVTNIGGGARYIRLTIDNGRDSVMRGDELVYDVQWENITKTDLEDLVLEVSFPEAVQVISTSDGQIDRAANTVYVNINELEALEEDDMTVRARVTGTLRDNDPVTARAIIAFENPENKAQENAIAYDSDSYYSNRNVLGASIFGLDFLPGTLAGWLFLILLIILVILIIRYAIRREEHHHYYDPKDGKKNIEPVVESSDDYYTPYRPTPKE